jgi:hypothetical protein
VTNLTELVLIFSRHIGKPRVRVVEASGRGVAQRLVDAVVILVLHPLPELVGP